jgi:hypothetical protein
MLKAFNLVSLFRKCSSSAAHCAATDAFTRESSRRRRPTTSPRNENIGTKVPRVSTGGIAVRRMWKYQTDELGNHLSEFELDALIERHCELFGTWPQ